MDVSKDESSVGQLSAQLAAQKRPKSPPLAFEKTPNDALAPLISPPSDAKPSYRNFHVTSPPSKGTMGRLHPSEQQEDLQVVVDQQASAISLLHDAFAAERQAWSLERERLYGRIARLEALVRRGEGHSPAKSPVLSPLNNSAFASPPSRTASNSHRLPSIAETENITPFSQRRQHAPPFIDLPTICSPERTNQRSGSVSFAEDSPASIKVEEIPCSPPPTANRSLSPAPPNYRMGAGHTPLRPPRPPTPPGPDSMAVDGVEDTPTRYNTHINAFLTESRDEDNDKALSGPLNMPELPNAPSDEQFTVDMLSKRLEQISQHPDDDGRPLVFKQKSPGLASPAEPDQETISPKSASRFAEERPIAPNCTRTQTTGNFHGSHSSALAFNSLSPNGMHALSKQVSRDEKVHDDFESGGIKLKKKASVNFGAPFGSLGGFGSSRKLS